MDLMSTARTLRPDQPFHCLRILPSRYTVFGVISQLNQKLGLCAELLAAFLLSLLCTAAAAQGMYKCKDPAGKITYAGKECRLIGLTDAGEVTGRASVTPAIKPAAASAAQAGAPAKAPATASQGAAKAPVPPERRCFTVKTAKGTATRCNDKPEDEPETK